MNTVQRCVAVAGMAVAVGGVGFATPAQAAPPMGEADHAARESATPRATWQRANHFLSKTICENDRLLTQHQHVPVSDTCFFTNTDGWYYLFWA